MTLPIAGDGIALSGHVVAVDIGGTKTHVAVAPVEAAGSGRTDEFVVSSASWRGALGDFRADAAGLRALLVGHLGESVLSAPLAVGAHGCDNTGQCRELEQSLRWHFTGPVVVVNDAELMAPAIGVSGAIGVVVGTGSIATVRDDGGELLTAGGWGWLLGDEGSAPALVRDATRAVLAHVDRGEAIDVLGQRLMAAFAARDGAELALAVTQTASAEVWGVHAPEVFTAADEGSVLAADVIRKAGDELASLVGRLRARSVHANAVVAGGSVIERQPRLQSALRSALERDDTDAELHILSRSPVMGAVALARGIAG